MPIVQGKSQSEGKIRDGLERSVSTIYGEFEVIKN